MNSIKVFCNVCRKAVEYNNDIAYGDIVDTSELRKKVVTIHVEAMRITHDAQTHLFKIFYRMTSQCWHLKIMHLILLELVRPNAGKYGP